MDASHFDDLTRSLTTGTRRGVVRMLSALPLLGGLLAFLGSEEGEAKGQRKRHKKPHHHSKHTGNRAGKKKKRRCKPESKARTCTGKCGSVKNNCKKTVDCGSCACDPPCDVCQICQEGPNTPGTCVPDPEQNGDPCATGDLCITGEVCSAGVCGGGTPIVCQPQDQCHEAGVCDSNTGLCSNPVVCNACQLADSCNPETGECAPDQAKQHTCDGPCPSGEWCDGGGCADIQDTVTIPDCHGLCNGNTDVCGQTVTCPSCSLCVDQTFCNSRDVPDGPVGPGKYCVTTAFVGGQTCTTNAECPGALYCALVDPPRFLCVNICSG